MGEIIQFRKMVTPFEVEDLEWKFFLFHVDLDGTGTFTIHMFYDQYIHSAGLSISPTQGEGWGWGAASSFLSPWGWMGEKLS